jgi:hypothetical protein
MATAICPVETASLQFTLLKLQPIPNNTQPAQPDQKGESGEKGAPKLAAHVFRLARNGLNVLKYI